MLKKEQEEERETNKKTTAEYERNVKLLVKKIKKMKRQQLAIDSERVQYAREFASLGECFARLKEELALGPKYVPIN